MGWIRQVGKRFRAHLYVGKQVGYISRQFGSRREAASWLAKHKAELDTGGLIRPTRITFPEFVDLFRRDYLDAAVQPKTRERYEELLRVHVLPRLGAIMLSKLAPLHIQGMCTALLKAGKSPRTVLHVFRLTHKVLEMAVRWQVLARNVCDAAEPPRVENHEVKIPSLEELAKLLEGLDGSPVYVPALLAYGAGLRRGEALALKWTDLDLNAGKLTVRQSLEQTRSGLRFKEPKSKNSRRTLDLPPVILDELKLHRIAQTEQRLALGPAWADHGLVVPHPLHPGQPWAPDLFSDTWANAVRKVGFPGVTFHVLRHANASLMAAARVPLKVASARLGHSGVGITGDLYSHLFEGVDREAALAINPFLQKAVGRDPR